MPPVLVESSSLSGLEVAQQPDGQFRCWKDGDASDLISGNGFVLASRSLAAEIERLCPVGLQVRPVQLLAVPIGVSESHFSELLIAHEVTPANINSLQVSGCQAWHFGRESLFVSPELAAALASGPFRHALAFSNGFSRFAGAA